MCFVLRDWNWHSLEEFERRFPEWYCYLERSGCTKARLSALESFFRNNFKTKDQSDTFEAAPVEKMLYYWMIKASVPNSNFALLVSTLERNLQS